MGNVRTTKDGHSAVLWSSHHDRGASTVTMCTWTGHVLIPSPLPPCSDSESLRGGVGDVNGWGVEHSRFWGAPRHHMGGHLWG